MAAGQLADAARDALELARREQVAMVGTQFFGRACRCGPQQSNLSVHQNLQQGNQGYQAAWLTSCALKLYGEVVVWS